MLARNFMTAKALRIRDDERAALVQVLGALERGELTHFQFGGRRLSMEPIKGFNMTCYVNESECGTIGCFAGWANILSGRKVFASILKGGNARTVQLDDLFYMRGCVVSDMERVTPDQAAEALRNYLTRGAPCWSEVLDA